MVYTLPIAPTSGSTTIDSDTDRFIWNGSVYDNYPSTTPKLEFSNWSARTPMTIGAVTTAPTKPASPVIDYVRFRSLGNANYYEVEYKYAHTVAGTGGSGEYLFSLPGGLRFDTSVHPTTAGSSSELASYSIPNALATIIPYGLNSAKTVVLPYSATAFRLWVYMDLVAARAVVNGGQYSLGTASIAYNISFKFTAQ